MQNDKKQGHIKHEDIDMDTHDRAVRRNAGSRSQAQSSSAPLWLICILIFVGVVGFFLIRLSAKMKPAESASGFLKKREAVIGLTPASFATSASAYAGRRWGPVSFPIPGPRRSVCLASVSTTGGRRSCFLTKSRGWAATAPISRAS